MLSSESMPPSSSHESSSIASVVRTLRLERGWTQQELAERAGLTAQTISNIERGRSERIYDGTVESLASAFGVTPSTLDPRRLGEMVARDVKTREQREAVELALTLPPKELKALLSALRERKERRKKRSGGRP